MNKLKTVVSDSALRELLVEALENQGAMDYDADPPIVPNPGMDRTTLQLDVDAIEIRHLPRTKGELLIMVRNLLDNVADDQSSELYKKIKDVMSNQQVGKSDFAGAAAAKNSPIPDVKQVANLQRDPNKMENKKSISNIIKSIVEAEMGMGKKRMTLGGAMVDPEDPETFDDPNEPKFLGGKESDSGPFDDEEDETASDWDPEPLGGDLDADDEDEDKPKKRKGRAGLDIGAYGVDGETLEKIGASLGFTQEAAKKAVETAMERFKALHVMDPDKRAELVVTGVNDYIDMLAKSGEMTEEEEEFMRLHPKVVAMSDTFRDFFSKYVKRATRELRADSQDDE
jgi:hypothetical protein